MNRHAFVLAVVLLAVTCAPIPGTADEVASDSTRASDPRAIAVADQVMQALGGSERWDRLVGLRWSFEVSVNDTVRSIRRHSWDKHTGWHRVSGTTRSGTPFTFCENLNTGAGMAWMGGHPVEGDSLAKLLKLARSLWINDTYWMLMPYKLRDPGVTLDYVGTARDGDQLDDEIALSFRDVGDTPGDHYWVYVDRATHRVDRWEMVLQGDHPPPKSYTWEGWEQHDGLWFATAKRSPDGQRVIYTRNLETLSSFPPTEFTRP